MTKRSRLAEAVLDGSETLQLHRRMTQTESEGVPW